MLWIGLKWLRIKTSGGLFRTSIELSDFIKCWEVLEWLTISGSSRRAQLRE
jgi:hypothetical protein